MPARRGRPHRHNADALRRAPRPDLRRCAAPLVAPRPVRAEPNERRAHPGGAVILKPAAVNAPTLFIRDVPPRTAFALEQSGVPPLLARLYAARGVKNAEEL